MSSPLPSMPAGSPLAIPIDAPSSTWDRISSWASENKAIVYTIAGVAVIFTGAGVVYYANSESVSLSISVPAPGYLNTAVPLRGGKDGHMHILLTTLAHRSPKPTQPPSSARRRGESVKRPSERPPTSRIRLLLPSVQSPLKASPNSRTWTRHRS